MSRTIVDERVVEMRFDNGQFERETKTTVNTLAKLKEALKIPGAEKALENVDKAARNISLDGIAEGVKLLSDRFSTMGIVGMRVIENITDALMNKLGAAVNYVSNAIVSGGVKRAMNIENAHFQLQALLKDEIKVQAVMDNAMESVDGTAYAYDEAAKAASQFAASGIEAGESMLQALKGITGVAAMTNSDFESISRIFTTVAGNGRLMGDQLLQLSSRGLNAASTIADYFKEVRGQANMTEGEIREMVSKGKMDFQTFSDAMTWAFGDSAKRANETFTGAMSNMKSALARIGAEFVSPLVEQNGELVGLFNALRIKINDVKSAIAFDEQASAVSGLSKDTELLVQTVANLTKNGSLGFEKFTSAILGTRYSEEQLTELNEKLADSFKEIQKEGYASNDALIEINRNGVRSYDALLKYINGVTNGTINANGEIKKSVFELTRGTEVSMESIYDFAKQGKISFDMVNNAIINYSGLVTKNSSITSDALKAMFASVKESGSVSNDMLKEFRANGIYATNALLKYINGVTDGTIRASYATKKAVEEMTGGVKVSAREIEEFADQGVINFDIFKSAMETSFGDSRALAKQATDFILDKLKALVTYINKLDMTKPMELFYYGVETAKNGVKSLSSVLKPVAKAASQVFPAFSIDDAIKIAEKLENLSAKLQLSEKNSENLRKAFKGVFDVAKALIDIVIKFIKALNPSFEPVSKLTDGMFGLAGSFGETLSKFAEWLNTSDAVNKGINKLAEVVKYAYEQLKKFKNWIVESFNELKNSPVTQNMLNKFGKTLKSLASNAKPFFETFKDGLKEIPKFFSSLFGKDSEIDVEGLGEGLSTIQDAASGLDFEKPISAFEKLKNAASGLGEVLMGNKGINTFVTNANGFFDRLIGSFKVETLNERVDAVMGTMDKFIDWIKKNLQPIFGDVTVGGVISAGSGIGMIYAILKLAKDFEAVANKIKAIPDMLGPIKGVLGAYQKELKSEQLVNIAKAIGILGTTLVLLSFADWDQMWKAAVVLGALSVAIMWGASKLLGSLQKVKTIPEVLQTVALGLKKALKNLGTALEIKAVTSGIKDLAKAMALIVGSIAAIFYMNKTDPDSLWSAVSTVGIIAGIMITIAGILFGLGVGLAKMGNLGQAAALGSFAGTIISFSASIYIVVSALKKLFKLTIPSDYEARFDMFTDLIYRMALVAITLTASNSLFGSNNIMQAAPILALAGMLYISVLALNNLFKMEIPPDWETKIGILTGMFVGLTAVMAILNSTARGSGVTLKAGSTLLGVAGVILAVTWSLKELSKISGNKLTRAVLSLDGVFLGLAVIFAHMDNVSNEKDTGKTVLYLAAVIAAATVSLGVLSMIPLPLLAKAVVALDAVLLTLALDFVAIGKITNEKNVKSILAMVLMTAVITAELYILSGQPWDGMLAGAAALSLVLLAMAGAFRVISGIVIDYTKETLAMFISMLVVLASITAAIYILAEQPWDGMLAGAAALSLVLLAFAAAFKIMGETVVEYDIQTFALMASLVGALWLIVDPLVILSEQPWDGMLAAGTALSEVLLAVSASALIVSKIKTDLKSGSAALIFLDAFIVDLTAVIAGLGAIKGVLAAKGIDLEELMRDGNGILAMIAGGISAFVGGLIGGIGYGIAASLGNIGKGLSDFMTNAGTFWDNISKIDEKTTKGMKNLAEAVLIITAADVMEGMFAWATGNKSVANFGAELEALGEPLKNFAESTAGVDAAQVEGAASALEILARASKSLPKIGGVAQAIFGHNISLTQMAEELADYGEAIVPFAEKVKDIDGDSVQGAADAASILGEMMKTLPKADGLAQKIFGTNKSLSDFAEELDAFGPSLRDFAVKVIGITPKAVEGATQAAELLSTMAKNMPNTDTLWENWFGGGTQSISSFSEELISFGTNMKSFADTVKNFNGSKINEVTKSFKALADLAVYMQDAEADSDTLVWFAGSLEFLATEGVDAFVTTFEKSDQKAKDAIKGLIKAATDAILDCSKTMRTRSAILGHVMAVAVAEGIGDKESLVTKKINELGMNMLVTLETAAVASLFDKITQNGLNGITTGINAKLPIIITTIKTLSNGMITNYKNIVKTSTFLSYTQAAFDGIITGITSKNVLILTAVRATCTSIVTALKEGLDAETIGAVGSSMIQFLLAGIILERVRAIDTLAEIAESLYNSINDNTPFTSYYQLGVSLMNSVISGIKSKTTNVATALQNVIVDANNSVDVTKTEKVAEETGRAALAGLVKGTSKPEVVRNVVENTAKVIEKIPKTARNVLQIHSPSKVMMEIGKYVTLGLSEGIKRYSGNVDTSSEELTNILYRNTDTLSKYLKKITGLIKDEDFDITPVITPIVDTSSVDRTIRNLNGQFGDLGDLSIRFKEAISVPAVEAKSISQSFNNSKSAESLNDELARKAINDLSDKYDTLQNKFTSRPEIRNTFNIYGDNPQEIAEEVSRIIQHQIEREDRKWG